jgi:hypothetical protein
MRTGRLRRGRHPRHGVRGEHLGTALRAAKIRSCQPARPLIEAGLQRRRRHIAPTIEHDCVRIPCLPPTHRVCAAAAVRDEERRSLPQPSRPPHARGVSGAAATSRRPFLRDALWVFAHLAGTPAARNLDAQRLICVIRSESIVVARRYRVHGHRTVAVIDRDVALRLTCVLGTSRRNV